MSDSTTMPRQQQHNALELLLSRQSAWPLVAPAPTQPELDLVLDAALRAPDHGKLRPWRLIVIRGEARHALGDVFAQAARARDPECDGERFRAKATAAPVLIALGVHLEAPCKIPELEQILAVGAGVMNMLNALHFLGYGGFWATGANTYDDNVKAALGLAPQDKLIGFLYAGTPKDAVRAAERPSRDEFVREWEGMAARAD